MDKLREISIASVSIDSLRRRYILLELSSKKDLVEVAMNSNIGTGIIYNDGTKFWHIDQSAKLCHYLLMEREA